VHPLHDTHNSHRDSPALTLDDIGILSGVVIVDRLRTVQGLGLDVDEHVARFEQSCQALGIELPSHEELVRRANQCVDQHRDLFAPYDFSLVMLATPGRQGVHPPQPTLIFQALPIDWSRLASWYQHGQRLSVSLHRNVPAACWSPAIKTRARLQYYLADQQARAMTGDEFAAALLLDTDGFLTETSAANVLIVEADSLVSPCRENILAGISLKRTQRLALRLGYRFVEEPITAERAQQADAILLCGSTGCLWPAASLGERLFVQADQHETFVRLAEAWKNDIALDFVQQATTCARLASTH
jgi:branched-chain amino acid aminotransferase